jgi:hypothetical protein
MAMIRFEKQVIDYDYSAYLGPNYKQTQIKPIHLSTYIGNHCGWLEILIMIYHYGTAFASKKALRKVPVFGLIT